MYVRISDRNPNPHAHAARIAVELNGIDETCVVNVNMYVFSSSLLSNKISIPYLPENTVFSGGASASCVERNYLFIY